MKVGTILQIETIDPISHEKEKLRCKVIDMKDQYIYIDYPVHIKTQKTKYLQKHAKVTITYVDKDQIAYQFKSKIIKRVKGKIPAFVLPKPEKEEIKKIQRRRFVRIEVAVDVAVHSNNQLFAPFTTVSTDISAGGLSFILPKELSPENGEIVEVTFVLPLNTGEYHYITTQAEIVNTKMLNERIQTASLKFIELDSKDQEKVIQFCFEKQREERQKELL